jgi:serine/threonine-protein kinase
MTFEAMRDFVTGYYGHLPANPEGAWGEIDTTGKNQTGYEKFSDFWGTIQSVTIVSISPRDATSVVARLRYVRRNGQSDTEDRWLRMALVNGAMMLNASGRIGAVSEPPTTGTTTTTTTTIAPPRPPVAAAALEGLLLSPDQINTAMGATGMTVAGTATGMVDYSASVADKACLPMVSPVQSPVYAGSGWSAVRGQGLRDPGDNPTHVVVQDVVLFSSAHDAGAFFTASAQSWPACANRQYGWAMEAGKPNVVYTVGPVSNTNRTLSATATLGGGDSSWTWYWSSCQRALTVANNVVIDVEACSANRSDSQSDAGVNIAHQSAAKVPT